MFWLEVLGGVVVLLALAFVLGRNLETLPDEEDDAIDRGLPEDRLLRSDDVPRLRFRVGLRGYRMSDVDDALDALQAALAAAEKRTHAADVSAAGPGGGPTSGPGAPPRAR
jgi:DivIVA domain-containing protein